MLTLRRLDPADAVVLLTGGYPTETMTESQWDALCQERGLLAFATEVAGKVTGFALAESHPPVVHVQHLEGDKDSCRVLLGQLLRQAGERDLSGWFAVERADIHRILFGMGFSPRQKADHQGWPSYFYYWDRNSDCIPETTNPS